MFTLQSFCDVTLAGGCEAVCRQHIQKTHNIDEKYIFVFFTYENKLRLAGSASSHLINQHRRGIKESNQIPTATSVGIPVLSSDTLRPSAPLGRL